MADYAAPAIVAWVSTVGITFVVTDSIVTTVMVGLLSGITALVAFGTGRAAGRFELEDEQKAARRSRRRKEPE